MTQLSYKYRAIDAQGQRRRGILQAENQTDAYRQLTTAGMKPLKLVARRRASGGGRKVGVKDLAHLTYQFSVLMDARIPIADGLRSIAEQESGRLQGVIRDVASQIEAGYSVTESLSQHREVFGDVYIETVRAAEVSGNMVKVLGRLAEMLERQHESNKNIKAAMIYPICVLVAMTLGVTFLMIFVIPKFTAMYASRGVDLPGPTLLLMNLSVFMRSYWPLILGGTVGVVYLVRKSWANRATRRKMDRWLHKVPFLRDILMG
ncbi:MAG: type II secretion system F family protein, partial [Planctomycetota bacterium]